MKRLKNIEDKNEEQLEAIENKTGNIKDITDFVKKNHLSLEAKGLIEEIKIIQKDVDYRKLKITGGHNITYDFSDYKTFKEFFRDLYYRNMTIDKAERKQDKSDATFGVLEIYVAKKKDTEAKKKLLNNAKNFYKSREKNIKDFKNGLFPLNYDDEEKQETRDKEVEFNTRNENELINYKKLNRLIHLKERDINNELVRKHFLVQNLVALLEKF